MNWRDKYVYFVEQSSDTQLYILWGTNIHKGDKY
jgi:hypothetical protein